MVHIRTSCIQYDTKKCKGGKGKNNKSGSNFKAKGKKLQKGKLWIEYRACISRMWYKYETKSSFTPQYCKEVKEGKGRIREGKLKSNSRSVFSVIHHHCLDSLVPG